VRVSLNYECKINVINGKGCISNNSYEVHCNGCSWEIIKLMCKFEIVRLKEKLETLLKGYLI